LHDLAAGVPENSTPAFEAAAQAGYPIELDVQLLADGALLVFHDDDLLRATGVRRALSECAHRDVVGLPLFGTPHHAPTLSDVLTQVDARVPILLEIKQRGPGDQLASRVHQALRGYAGQVAVQSFNPYVLRWFRRHAPDQVLGQLGGPLRDDALAAFEKLASRSLITLALSRPDFINFDLRALPDRWVDAVSHATGLPLLAWTVRTEADRQKAVALGVNYVFEGIRP